MTGKAFLGMYDLPAQHAANDRIWATMAQVLTAQGIADVPAALTRDIAPERLWRDPALLFGQACGYPLVSRSLPLRVLALPVYDVDGCGDGRHRSVIVTRRGEPDRSLAAFRGCRAAINDPASNSGMNLFRATIAPIAGGSAMFSEVIVTGAHRDSIRAILRGEADLAAIDAVSFAGLQRFEPDLVRPLRIVADTHASPTLPFVTAQGTPDDVVAALHAALDRAITDPALADARAALFLTGLAPAPADAFRELTAMRAQAASQGYPVLA